MKQSKVKWGWGSSIGILAAVFSAVAAYLAASDTVEVVGLIMAVTAAMATALGRMQQSNTQVWSAQTEGTQHES